MSFTVTMRTAGRFFPRPETNASLKVKIYITSPRSLFIHVKWTFAERRSPELSSREDNEQVIRDV